MYACSRQLILYPFSKIIEVLSFLESQRFTRVDPWPGLQHEAWVSPMNQDLTTIGKQLVTPIMFMPLLYLWAYFAWPNSAVDYKFVIQKSAQHLLVLWKLTRKALSSKLPYSTSLYSTSSVTKLSGIFSNRPYSHGFFAGGGATKIKNNDSSLYCIESIWDRLEGRCLTPSTWQFYLATNGLWEDHYPP